VGAEASIKALIECLTDEELQNHHATLCCIKSTILFYCRSSGALSSNFCFAADYTMTLADDVACNSTRMRGCLNIEHYSSWYKRKLEHHNIDAH
jgi:hypothetical protein